MVVCFHPLPPTNFILFSVFFLFLVFEPLIYFLFLKNSGASSLCKVTSGVPVCCVNPFGYSFLMIQHPQKNFRLCLQKLTNVTFLRLCEILKIKTIIWEFAFGSCVDIPPSRWYIRIRVTPHRHPPYPCSDFPTTPFLLFLLLLPFTNIEKKILRFILHIWIVVYFTFISRTILYVHFFVNKLFFF